MPRHVFSDTHEWINEMPTVLSTIARIHSHGHINFLPFLCVVSVSLKSSYSVKTRTLSEVRLEGPQLLRTMRGQNTLIARAAYSFRLRYESVQTAFVPNTHADAGLFLSLQAAFLLILIYFLNTFYFLIFFFKKLFTCLLFFSFFYFVYFFF